MTVRERFIPIPELVRKVLARLSEQRGRDRYGAIGWNFPVTEFGIEREAVPALWQELLARALVEDLTGILGETGKFFVRVTPLGERCAAFGLVLSEARAAKAWEMEALEKELEALRTQTVGAQP